MTYDIFFISYEEPNCEEHWQQLLKFHPEAKRVHGVQGIDRAHMRCRELSTTERFWTVDGDNWITSQLECGDADMLDNFDLLFFNAIDAVDKQRSSVGGIKLWRRDKFINTDMSKGDFSTKATETRRAVQRTLSEHRYNRTPYDTWKFAFRHMVKCYSGIIGNHVLEQNIDKFKKHQYLDDGTNNALWSYQGFIDAKEYVEECGDDFDKINLINNYVWLRNKAPKEV
jgi:hypothetical protein